MTFNKYIKIFIVALSTIFFMMENSAFSFKERGNRNVIEEREFRIEELYISQTNSPVEMMMDKLPNKAIWESFLTSNKNGFAYIDPRSGRPVSLTFIFPFIPGDGVNNHLTLKDISAAVSYKVSNITEKEIKTLALQFLNKYSSLLLIDVKEIDEIKVGRPADYLWQIYISRKIGGIPVRDSNITLTINHGNLVLWGVEKWGTVNISLVPEITAEEALRIGFSHIAGQLPTDKIIVAPHLEIIPISPANWDGTVGKGYDHLLVWSFIFKRQGYPNTWEMLIDAHKGKLISFQDLNQYVAKKIIGAIYPLSDDECCPDGCAVSQTPMPFTNTGFAAPNDFTNLGGFYDYSSGTASTTLDGKYTNINDNCGSINETSTTGDIDLSGTNGQHDCTTPGAPHSAGDTFSSRSAFAELTWINRTARGWVNYAWLDSSLTTNVNIASTCNAYWDGVSVNFYRSGGGCRNTGEIAAVFDHEWGHGIDDNDTNGNISSPGEAIADIVSTMRLHNSCVGRGFFWTYNAGCGQWTNCPSNPGTSYGYNCGGYGDCCIGCTGIRESDYAKHASNNPHTPANFICTNCSAGGGPCGKEVHCENAPTAEAAWDLAARDLQSSPFNYDKQTAFEIATRIVYLGSGNVTNWYTCSCPSTSNGCGANNGYMQWITADDDNGNLNDGTPHMTAIYAAFNRHGIACSTPSPVNSGCSGGPTLAPTLSATSGSNSVSLSWSSVSGASQYYVYRTEGMGCDFGKIKIATASTTSYTDSQALNGRTYYYTVQAVGSNSACLGLLSNCVSATPSGTSSITYDVYVDGALKCANISTTSCNPGALANGSHNWYVIAKNSCGNTTGPTWSFTQATTPGQASNPNPSDGSTVCGTPTLSWTAGSWATSYDVYVDGSLKCSNITTTSCNPGALPNGSHSWYVVSKNSCGNTTGPTWAFTQSSAPAQASNPNPSNGSTVCGTPTLSWAAASGATAYDVYVDGSLKCSNITTTSCNPGSLPNGSHNWYVVSKNNCGSTTGPSWSFTQTSIPGQATNPNPANGATICSSPTLSWSAASEATSYDVYTDGSIKCSNITTTSCNPGPLSGGPHSWYVVSKNICGNTTGPTWTFTIDITPPNTSGWNSLMAAKNGANVNLSWNPIADATAYNIYRDTIPNSPWGPSQKINTTPISGTAYTDTPPSGTIFYYIIKALDACGNESSYP